MFGGPNILKEGAGEEKGDVARLQAFVGAIAIGDLVKSTLGPKGMDKILQPMPQEGGQTGQTMVTNDGATILKSVWIDSQLSRFKEGVQATVLEIYVCHGCKSV